GRVRAGRGGGVGGGDRAVGPAARRGKPGRLRRILSRRQGGGRGSGGGGRAVGRGHGRGSGPAQGAPGRGHDRRLLAGRQDRGLRERGHDRAPLAGRRRRPAVAAFGERNSVGPGRTPAAPDPAGG